MAVKLPIWATLIALAATASNAQALLDRPASVTTVETGVTRLPLPQGRWTLVAKADRQATQNGGGLSQVPITTQIYVQAEQGKLAAILSVTSNASPNLNGWTPAPACARTDVYWTEHRNGWTKNYDCLLVNHIVMREGPKTAEAWRTVYKAAAALGGMPKQMIMVQLSDGKSMNEISVDLYLNPEISGFTPSTAGWSDSEWQTGNVDQGRRAYLDQVVRWAKSYRSIVRDAVP